MHYMYGVGSGNYSDCNYVKYRMDGGKWKQSAAVAINNDGTHPLVIKNQGASNGKVVIGISRD